MAAIWLWRIGSKCCIIQTTGLGLNQQGDASPWCQLELQECLIEYLVKGPVAVGWFVERTCKSYGFLLILFLKMQWTYVNVFLPLYFSSIYSTFCFLVIIFNFPLFFSQIVYAQLVTILRIFLFVGRLREWLQ